MKSKEVSEHLKRLGWSTRTDEVGDRSALFVLPDRVVSIIFGIRKYMHEQGLEVMQSVSTDAFSGACARVRSGRSAYSPLVSSWKGWELIVPEVLEAHVRQASDESIEWAQKQDLDSALQSHAELPTMAPGARPVWHLAALALSGETENLEFYLSEFEEGNRLGFVDYISKDHILRALKFAEKHTLES